MSLLACMLPKTYVSMGPGIPESYRSRAKHVLKVFSRSYIVLGEKQSAANTSRVPYRGSVKLNIRLL
jgi:hypothetical protein